MVLMRRRRCTHDPEQSGVAAGRFDLVPVLIPEPDDQALHERVALAKLACHDVQAGQAARLYLVPLPRMQRQNCSDVEGLSLSPCGGSCPILLSFTR